MIFGSNAVCRYFSYKGGSAPTTANLSDAAEEWLDWEAVTLAPAERLLAASREAGGPVPEETLAALKHLEDKLAGAWLLEGVRRRGISDFVARRWRSWPPVVDFAVKICSYTLSFCPHLCYSRPCVSYQ